VNPKLAKPVAVVVVALLFVSDATPASAQEPVISLSGTITDPSGKTVADAAISVRNVATGQSMETRSDSDGRFQVNNLAPGEYEVSVSAPGFRTSVSTARIGAAAGETLNLALGRALSLGDLGFEPSQTAGNAEDQALLDKRSHMLKLHQQFGLITMIPLTATVILGSFAGGRATSSTDRVVHASLGGVTVVLYGTTAYFALFAPKVSDAPTRGNIRLHKALAWVHGTGMILTPILGEMAYQQKSQGEKVHGIASAHGAVGIATLIAYAAAILTETLK
jgi:hypothetical protein